jgi:ElaB/YqjD/DUF883 family membrane-anchored ribosome-binding protein
MTELLHNLEKPVTAEEVIQEISRMKSVVTDAVDDGVRSALRTIKQGKVVAGDVIYDAKRAVRQDPLQSMGIVFAAGVMAGALAAWIGSRRS